MTRIKKHSFAYSLALLLGFALILSGCGYEVLIKENVVALQEAGKAPAGKMPEDIKTLAIPYFKNLTDEVGVESVLTFDLIEEFTNSVEIVDESEADAVLACVVKAYRARPISFTRTDVVQEYKLVVSVGVVLISKPDDVVLWEMEKISHYENFFVDTRSPLLTEGAEEDALKLISFNLSRRIREGIMLKE